MEKATVFFSHIHEEQEIAIAFKDLIEDNFLGMVEVFVSSDDRSVKMGQKWLDNVTEAAKKCSVAIIFCSHVSVKRPWINFEAGIGWIRDIPIIPLCHSGMEPNDLPIPLNLLQAAKVSEVSSLKLIIPIIADAIGSNKPNIDFTEFLSKVNDFEKKYTFWNICNEKFTVINNIDPKIIQVLKQGNTVQIELTEYDIRMFEDLMLFFTPNKILQLRRTGNLKVTNMGTYYLCEIVPLSSLSATVKDSNFKYI